MVTGLSGAKYRTLDVGMLIFDFVGVYPALTLRAPS